MPTKHARLNLVRDPRLEAKIAGLSSYARAHGITRDADLVREMIDAGYAALRRRELQEAVARNLDRQDDSIAEAATRAYAQDGPSDA